MKNRINLVMRYAIPAGLAMISVGCDQQEGPHAIHELEIRPGMGAGSMPMDAIHGFSGGQPMAMPQGESPEIEFDAPEGWAYEPGSGMRAATFKIKDTEGGQEATKEATLVILPGMDEGYAPNIRRWLGQLGIELSEQALESFIAQREEFSTVGNVSGALFDFTRLKGTQGNAKGHMLAAMIETEGQSIFVKLMGDEPFLRRNKEDFLKLSKSIRLPQDGTESPSAGSACGAPGASQSGGSMGTGMGGGMTMQSSDPAFNRVPSGVSRLTWQTPENWKSKQASGMRTGSFSVTYQGKTADGSIVQLNGPAGGVESNVRRWMEQAGMTQLDDKAMKAFLETQIKIRTKDGFDGILINLASQLSGDLLQENSILAVIIHAPQETIFVKLTGPRPVLLQNVEALAQLGSSLKIVN